MPHQGSCLCGQTKITIASDQQQQLICHCLDCRQTSGSAFATNAIVLQKDVTITGPIKTYESKAATGNIVTRVFCGICGSAISHKSAYFGDKQAVQTGNFADFAKIPFLAEIFIKDRWTGLAPIEGAAQVQANP
ncbi:hypothetical protein Hypma_005110 [Hypsizygus marmoreus]|uniref:CENP-V/GFA domain-containing protein n=1 Tax=Hypsizygus marmoreus TaxID=39966 RepID=A0A369K2P7_HYPMA|nr:hypothetical protein Hypma_005110 [Hypsizygus marmoreus]